MELKVLTRQMLADTETPVSAFMKLCGKAPDACLLESAETSEAVGRYSIVAWDPLCALELRHDRSEGIFNGEKARHGPEAFFPLIRQTLQEFTCPDLPALPAVGSLMGFVGYDAVRLIERLPPAPEMELPFARLAFPSRFVIFDHLQRLAIAVVIAEDDGACQRKLREIEERLHSALRLATTKAGLEIEPPPSERYIAAVEQAKEYIRAGDIFQVVLADRFTGRTDLEPLDLYRWLRVRSPSPYMFFLNYGGYQLVGASPETLVKVRDGTVHLRPIAGTRGRSAEPQEDRLLEEELLASEKERAEHIMLVDLARNDAGRVCSPGSVSVAPYMIVERYSHVMHLVSAVQGRLRQGRDSVDTFMAAFPAGTVSGAPKVRAMEIIDELEAAPRGPYAGAVGYFGPRLEMDTCIAIRMVLFQDREFTIQVGAGIVADSIPEMEYEEIQHKAAQSIAALRSAAGGTP